MFCQRCGTQNQENANFCSKCGQKMNDFQTPIQYSIPYQPQNTYPPQTPYPQPQSYPPYYQQEMAMQAAANEAANNALVYGIICIFTFGLLFGILAVVQGNKANKFGYIGGKATAGIVLGIIGIVGWAIVIIMIFAQLSI